MKSHEFVAHSSSVTRLALSLKPNKLLATGSEDCMVNIWRIDYEHENNHHSTSTLSSSSSSPSFEKDTPYVTKLWTLASNKSPIRNLCFDSENKCVVSGCLNGSIKVFDIEEGKLARNLGGHQIHVTSMNYHPYGEFLASGSIDSSVKLWDVRNKTCIQTFTSHDKEITCLRFSPDGRWIASSSKDGTLAIHDLVAGKPLHTLKMTGSSFPLSFEFNPSEFLLAVATSARTVRMFDLDSMEAIMTTPSESSTHRSICFSTDGSKLFTTTKDYLRTWTWDSSLQMQSTTDVQWDKLHEIKVSDDGILLSVSCHGSTVNLSSINLNSLTLPELPVHRQPELFNQHTSESKGSSDDSNYTSLKFQKEKHTTSTTIRSTSARNSMNKLSDDSENNLSTGYEVKDEASLRYDNMAEKATEVAQGIRLALREANMRGEGINSGHWESASTSRLLASTMRLQITEKTSIIKDESSSADTSIENDTSADWHSPGKESIRVHRDFSQNHDSVIPSSVVPTSSSPSTSHCEDAQSAKGSGRVGSTSGKMISPRRRSSDIISSTPPVSARSRNLPPLTSIDKSYNGSIGSGRVLQDIGVEIFIKERQVAAVSEALHLAMNQDTDQQIRTSSSSSGGRINTGNSSGRSDNNRLRSPIPNPNPNLNHVSQYNTNGINTSYSSLHTQDQIERTSRDGNIKQTQELIDRIISSSTATTAAFNTRLASLRMLRKLWLRRDLPEVLDYLNVIYESSQLDATQMITLGDFVTAVGPSLRSVGFTLAHTCRLSRIFESMISDKSEHVLRAGLQAFIYVLQLFAQLIYDTRSCVIFGSVDLSHEDRLRKCNDIYTIICRVRKRIETVKKHAMGAIKREIRDGQESGTSGSAIQQLLLQLTPLVDLAIS